MSEESPRLFSRDHGGHIDQMLRQTRAHHVILSQAADAKAAMLITVSAIAVPLTIRAMETQQFRVPGAVLILGCIATVCLAAYAAMPKLRTPKVAREPTHPLYNALFFGDFIGLTLPQYMELMDGIVSERSRVYEAQVREVYTLGLYLAHRKYRPLRYAYIAFIAGMLASLGSWAVARALEWFGVIGG